MIKLADKYFSHFIEPETIDNTISQLAHLIYQDCKDEIPLFVGILNGSFMFCSDFIRHYPGQCEVSFVKLSSYEGLKSTGKVKQLVGFEEEISNRTIIILEDIIDTGATLEEIYNIFSNKKLKSLKIATLFLKPDVYKKALHIDYVGQEIPDIFVVGYGMDYDGLGRNLKGLYKLNTPIMTNIVLFGPPGAGKGTQAEILKEKYNLKHISTGDVFRYNIKNKTDLGMLAKSFMDKGDLVPDEVTINMLKAEVEKNSKAKGFIFDGFPRTESQAKALDTFLAQKGATINGMVALEVEEDLLVQRLLKRGETSGRSDDQDESKIRNRFNEYQTKTAVLKEYYAQQGKYYGVNGVGTIEDINLRLCEVIDTL